MKNTKHSFADLPVLDGHIHFGHFGSTEGLLSVLDDLGIGKFNIVCTPDQARLSLVPDALYLKAQAPERVYVFGGMDISTLFMEPQNLGGIYADYVDTLLGMGCDGIKMIEGKPQIRQVLPIPDFDSPVYEPYWQRLEERQVPVVFHVNDPEEFWDAQKAPDWAHERGWFYGDGSFVNNEDQYRQVLNVLERHPRLKIIFAHFFFLSAQLERLSEYLERFPNMHVDLTPGVEMYHNFSKDPEKAREFFLRWQDRIVFGTDIGVKALLATPELGVEQAESASRVTLVRAFLENENEFWLPSGSGFLFGDPQIPFQGLHLPQDILRKIYYQNFEKLTGAVPRPLNIPAIITECARLKMTIPAMGAAQPDIKPDVSVVEEVLAFFSQSI